MADPARRSHARASGSTAAATRAPRNSYAVEWAQLHREAIAEAGIDGFFFSRSAYTTSPAASPLFWLGDQLTTWDEHDGMASALTGMLEWHERICPHTLRRGWVWPPQRHPRPSLCPPHTPA